MTAAAERRLVQSTAAMTGLTLVSRATGLVRILVVAAVLGPTFLGNTYQSANTVPNLVFELFVAGALQAALIPSLVHALDSGEEEAGRVAASVFGLSALVLGGLALVAAALAPWLMGLLVAGVDDPSVRRDQIALGTVLLWIFLPQVVMYAAGLVATGVLNARERFLLPVAAPILNNVVVIGSYLWFDALRGGKPPTLDLSAAEIAVLGGGTTAGVLAFTMVPVLAVVRSGVSLRPRLDHRHPLVRRVGRHGAWAAAWLAGTQVLVGVVLVLANGVEGGVVVYQVAFTLFLLPHALFAVPVLTALFPRMSRQAAAGEISELAASVGRGLRGMALLTVPAAAGLIVLGAAVARVVLVGEGEAVAGDVGRAAAAFAFGLPGYGAFLFLTRAFYAAGDARTPALVAAGLAVGGAGMLIGGAVLAGPADRVVALAAAHSAAYTVASVVLAVRLRRSVLHRPLPGMASSMVRILLMAGGSAGVMSAVTSVLDGGAGRLGVAVVDVAIPAAAGGAFLLLTDRLAGGEGWRAARLLIGGSRG